MKNTANNPSDPQLVLRDKAVHPSQEVLAEALGGNYALYGELTAAAADLGLVAEWKYYIDGKAWLCRVCRGKKTIFWLSVWDDGALRVTFYFAERMIEGVLSLDIAEGIKEQLCRTEPKWRLIALILEVGRDNMNDIQKIARYKKDTK